jgi:hypothetical protein
MVGARITRSLTKKQWTDELSMRFMDDICREITSLAVRERYGWLLNSIR